MSELIVSVKITHTTEQRNPFSSDRTPIVIADVKLVDGSFMSFSQYEDEDYWVADSAFSKNGFPVFSNGPGARYGGHRTADPITAAYLDEQVKIAAYN